MVASEKNGEAPPAVDAVEGENSEDYLLSSPVYRDLTPIELEDDPSMVVILTGEATLGQILALPAPYNMWWAPAKHCGGEAVVPGSGGHTLQDSGHTLQDSGHRPGTSSNS